MTARRRIGRLGAWCLICFIFHDNRYGIWLIIKVKREQVWCKCFLLVQMLFFLFGGLFLVCFGVQKCLFRFHILDMEVLCMSEQVNMNTPTCCRAQNFPPWEISCMQRLKSLDINVIRTAEFQPIFPSIFVNLLAH